ncbi:Protein DETOXIFICATION 46 chloroplastic [Bienertia sinuspersici]
MQSRAMNSHSPYLEFKPTIIKQNHAFSLIQQFNFNPPFPSHFWRTKPLQNTLISCIFKSRNLQKVGCINPSKELYIENSETHEPEIENINVEINPEIQQLESLEPTNEVEDLASQSTWDQIVEIVKFSGPATGLWICGPLMSLIDTAVIGQSSSIELAALGPGTVLCDYVGFVFMFLSIATSNMVATSLAQKDENQVQHQISILLFVGLASGLLMFILTKCFGEWALTAFAGLKNAHLVPAANSYVQIRALAWPAILIGSVAQSASLGMKDSMGPLKALLIASSLNGIGDVVLCTFLGYGITGAAWATTASQVVAAYAMIGALNRKGMLTGLLLATIATSVPFVVPNFFTSDPVVIGEMRKVWIFFFLALSVTPCVLPCEVKFKYFVVA